MIGERNRKAYWMKATSTPSDAIVGTRRNAISVFPIEMHRHAAGANIPHHVAAAEPNHTGNRDGRKNLDHRVINRVGHDRVFERVHVAAINFRRSGYRPCARD